MEAPSTSGADDVLVDEVDADDVLVDKVDADDVLVDKLELKQARR